MSDSGCSCRDSGSVEAAADVIPTIPNEADGHGMIAFSLLIVVLTIVLWRLCVCHRTKKEKNMLKGAKLDMLCPQVMVETVAGTHLHYNSDCVSLRKIDMKRVSTVEICSYCWKEHYGTAEDVLAQLCEEAWPVTSTT